MRQPALLVLSALLLPLGALPAQESGPAVPQWQEQPGVLEFSGRMIVRPLQEDALVARGMTPAEARQAHEAAAALLDGWRIRYYADVDEHIVRVPEGLDESTFAGLLMGQGLYEYAHPDWICYPLGAPNDPFYGNQWQHRNIHSEAGWDIHTGDPGTIAAWIDTGVDLNHPDLAAALVPGYNSVDKLPQASGGDVQDINGHGTFVGGCIGAIGNNGIGVAGVGWNLSLMPVKTSNISSGGAYLSDILDGARWAVQHGAKTASASYSGVDNPSVGTTGTQIKADGGLFFYAAGNNGSDLGSFDYPDTVVVGATDSSDNRASWSNYGTPIDVVAPGVSVWSTTLGGGYGSGSGTSFSTPIANGVTAMVWSANPFLDPDGAQRILYSTCDNIGSSFYYGNGRVNLENALNAAITGSLVLTGGPLVAGQPVTFDVSGATPNGIVYFGYSLDGIAAVPEPAISWSIGLVNPVLLGQDRADASGNAALTRSVPAGTTGTLVWVQAAETGNASNILAFTIQ